MSSTAEWLDQCLHDINRSAELPYDADVKWTVRQHLLDLVAAFPTLTLKVQNYTHTNGRVSALFVAEGTLPMFYQGVKYNIPVAVWLPEKYPRAPPIVYVVPTQDMMIKPRHSFVTPSGVVNSAYVQNWGYRSTLEVLGHDTSIHFGQEPPLFQKPPNFVAPEAAHLQHSNARPPPPTNTFHNPINRPNSSEHTNYAQPSASTASEDTSPWKNVTALANQSPERSEAGTPPRRPPKSDLKEVFRATAIKALSERLTQTIASANEQAARDTDALFEEQAELGRRNQELDRGLQEAQAERSALETCVLQLSGKRVALERWIVENESKTPEGDIDPDSAIVAADVLSQQALDAQAEDLALEDALYSLNKALQDSVISPEAYMKQVRNVCHKQFYSRALGMKVAQKQHEIRRNAMASHHPPQHVQMPQGDSWTNTGVLAR